MKVSSRSMAKAALLALSAGAAFLLFRLDGSASGPGPPPGQGLLRDDRPPRVEDASIGASLVETETETTTENPDEIIVGGETEKIVVAEAKQVEKRSLQDVPGATDVETFATAGAASDLETYLADHPCFHYDLLGESNEAPTATQSSTCYGGDASRAIDGNFDGNWGGKSVTHTCGGGSWLLEFPEGEAAVAQIRIHGRSDCCTSRLDGAAIELLRNGAVVATETLGDMSGVLRAYLTFSPVQADAVRVRNDNVLSLAEVQVVGYRLSPLAVPVIPTPIVPTLELVWSDVARGRMAYATQSSTCWGGEAGRAVDGNFDGNWGGKSVSHTCINYNQWWKVELGSGSEEVAILAMIFHGRSDCCPERMSNAVIDVFDSNGEKVASQDLGDMAGATTKELDFGSTAGGVRGSTVKVSTAGKNPVVIAGLEVLGAQLCPSEAGLSSAKTLSGGGKVAVAAVGEEGKLCTLTRVTRDDTTGEIVTIVPMARSYDFQEWNNAAGEIPAVAIPGGWNCFAGADATFCAAHLPEPAEGEEYLLTSYFHALPARDRVARLLETATYGPTPEDLAAWNFASPLDSAMAAWVAEQMDPVATPMTSHREFWRRRANNAHTWGTVSVGPASDPCTAKSRWRKVAKGIKELHIYRVGTPITVEPIYDEANNVTKYLYSVHGQLRSVLDEAQKDLANPPVNFTGFEHLAPRTLHLPAVGVAGEVGKLQLQDSGYLLETPVGSLPSPGLCSAGLPPPETTGDAIVGRLPDGEWVIIDAVLEQRTNTLTAPLPDGGGFAQNVTSGVALCANAPRTFLNKDWCQMSQDERACAPEARGGGGAGTLVCGSPGETSNDVALGRSNSFSYGGAHEQLRDTNPLWLANTRRSTWSHISITADDQLRQRMAFALSQIFALVRVGGRKSEEFTAYYDIFLRNAFGNYRDILMEVSYSPMMATTLTYMQSKSQAFVRKTQNYVSLADENFAREVMQLFTIGTVLLNLDGTLKRDQTGEQIDAYSNLNIMNFARAWTGFDRQQNRGNIEDQNYNNNIDPMKIETDWRDMFPISNLDGGYIGDHVYPLCEDLPPKVFLAKGATYRFLGSSKMPETMKMNPEYLGDETMVEVELNLTSQLRTALCNGAGPDCKDQPPQHEVVLPNTISCATGTIECDIDNVRVVKVADGRYWEYIRPACVEQAFYEGGKKLGLHRNDQDGVLCANPRLPAAFEACCDFPPPTEVCEQCFDGNPCTEDLCSENGECLHPPIPGCANGAFVDYFWTLYEGSYGNYIDPYENAGDAIKNDPRYPDSPSETKLLTTALESPRYVDNYGARLRAYIVPPTSGNYTFYVRGDDIGELWLSSNSSPEGLGQEPVAYFTKWTSSFTTDSSQKSHPVDLVRGQVYYIEAFLSDKGGGDHLAVGWESADAGITLEVVPTFYTQQTRDIGTIARMHNLYDDERVTYSTATARCDAHAAGVSWDAFTCDYSFIDDTETPAYKAGYHWTDVSCQILIKVTEDKTLPGWISIVHNPLGHNEAGIAQHVDASSENFFPAVWNCPTEYPSNENMCGGAESGCEVLEDGSGCLCATSVSESPGYDAMPPSVDHALGTLFIGAVDPAISGPSASYITETDPATRIVAHKKMGEDGGAAFDQDTVFEVSHERTGRTFFLKNVISTVSVIGTSYSFRNAPHFLSLTPSETDLKDAQYQTDAVIDHYIYHENTAPFLARLFIQRLNMASNPTPMFVEAVATAFQTGMFVFDDGTGSSATFGSGEYGDLAATVSAILLHPEARSPTIDADPASGSVRQPLIKIIAVLRALGLSDSEPDKIHRIARTINDKIGQGPHDYLTVFSHFLPDYQSRGRGGSAGLYAPEEMVLDLPRIAHLLNGFYGTMLSWGFNSRYGFGQNWSGTLSWTQASDASASEVIDEVATLLTAGRLSTENRALIAEAYTAKYDSTGGWPNTKLDAAKKHALELVTSSAEFHTTNIVTKSGKDRNADATAIEDEDNTTTVDIENPTCGEAKRPTNATDADEEGAIVDTYVNIGGAYVPSLLGYADFPDNPTSTSSLTDLMEIVGTLGWQCGRRIATYITAPATGDYTFWIASDDGGSLYLSRNKCPTDKGLIAYNNRWTESREFDKEATQKSAPISLVAGETYYLEALYTNGGGSNHFAVAWAVPGVGDPSVPVVIESQYFHKSPSVSIETQAPTTSESPSSSPTIPPTPSPTERDYKAVVFLNLDGGVDSFNMLVPHTCVGTEGGWPYEGQTLDEQYQSARGSVALSKDVLRQIDSGNAAQPCTVFGLHPRLEALASLYSEGDALFVANAGYMSDPDFRKTVGQVSGHSSMSHYAAKVDAYSRYGDTGVLGRMRDALISSGKLHTSAISIGGGAVSVNGQGGRSPGPVAVGTDGVPPFPNWIDDASFLNQVESLNNATTPDSGFMAEAWSSKLHQSLSVTNELREGLEAAPLATSFVLDKDGNPLGEQLKMVSRLQQINVARGVTRDFYHVGYGSFDHHGGLAEPLDAMFKLVDEALAAYVAELKAIGLWESTVLVETSEFGRQIGPNGNAGTDHGWGGHYFVIGGRVRGGRIVGKYPDELWLAMKASGRRVVPTTPWDSIWQSVAEWMGVSGEEGLNEVCPNREKFDSETLFNAATMFTNSCGDIGVVCTASVDCCSLSCHGDGLCV